MLLIDKKNIFKYINKLKKCNVYYIEICVFMYFSRFLIGYLIITVVLYVVLLFELHGAWSCYFSFNLLYRYFFLEKSLLYIYFAWNLNNNGYERKQKKRKLPSF